MQMYRNLRARWSSMSNTYIYFYSFSRVNIFYLFWLITEMLQKILEKPLEKKAGRNYGPPGNKTLIYFLDDMNMPEVK